MAHFTEHERRRHIEAWRKSGLSQAAYCRAHGLMEVTFSNWKKSYPQKTAAATLPALIPLSCAPSSHQNKLACTQLRVYLRATPSISCNLDQLGSVLRIIQP